MTKGGDVVAWATWSEPQPYQGGECELTATSHFRHSKGKSVSYVCLAGDRHVRLCEQCGQHVKAAQWISRNGLNMSTMSVMAARCALVGEELPKFGIMAHVVWKYIRLWERQGFVTKVSPGRYEVSK